GIVRPSALTVLRLITVSTALLFSSTYTVKLSIGAFWHLTSIRGTVKLAPRLVRDHHGADLRASIETRKRPRRIVTGAVCEAYADRDRDARAHSRAPGRGHSITSSARTKKVSGIFNPIALAVVMLTNSSNFVGCMTGRSAGLSPLRMRPT